MNEIQPKKTFLGMPGYGKQTAAAGRGLWRARRDMSSVAVEYRQGSLLAANFNGLWCRALNACLQGEPIEYFAMLHDDIGPDDFWLDTLIEELEECNLDVLGVPVPIKDQRGLTSLAIDGDGPWRPKCRLTSSEIMSLPPTFTSDLLGGPLLLNTGCWVCRFDPEWAKKVRFTVNDRIVFNRTLGIFQAEVEPEDWYFSRLCHELNLRIGATRKVHVEHRGEVDFLNSQVRGNSFDDEYVNQSTLDFVFPFDVDGWLSPEEGLSLRRLAEGKRVLEIGSYCGRSTICLASSAESVTSLDYHDGRGTPNPQYTMPKFRENLERYGVSEKVRSIHPDGMIPLPSYSLIFIDGAHDYESVCLDIEKALSVLEPGGLIVFHDYRISPCEFNGWDEGVTQAVNDFIGSGAEIISRHESVAVVRPMLKPLEVN